jgi:glycosyltransferase involved in cell wall biosynthesis
MSGRQAHAPSGPAQSDGRDGVSGRFRIAVVMPVATQRGGAEMTLLHALRHGRTDACWLVAFLEDGPMVQAARDLGALTVVISAGRVREVGRLVAAIRRLGAVVRAWRPDMIVSWMSKAHLYVAPVAGLQRIPSAWFQHSNPSARDPLDRLATLMPARAVLAPSNTVAALQDALWPHRAVHVVHPGIDLDGLGAASARAPSELRSSLGIPEGSPVVGLVARLQRWKGVHVLIEALPALLSAHPGVHVVVVGGDHPLEPGYREQLLGLARRLGVTDRVHLVGYQPDPLSWMRAFDVVVHASDNEPFGLVVLEAMALGKPLVAGAAGGPTEIVTDETDGFLVEYGDAGRLAERIGAYLSDPALAGRMGGVAAQRARDFSAASFANDVVTALRRHGRRSPRNPSGTAHR